MGGNELDLVFYFPERILVYLQAANSFYREPGTSEILFTSEFKTNISYSDSKPFFIILVVWMKYEFYKLNKYKGYAAWSTKLKHNDERKTQEVP